MIGFPQIKNIMKYTKLIPDNAAIEINIFNEREDINSKASATGEILNIVEAFNDVDAINSILNEMIEQIEIDIPENSKVSIRIETDDKVLYKQHSYSQVKKSGLNELLRSLVNELGFQEESEIVPTNTEND